MRLLIKLIVSLIITAGTCYVLLSTGVIKLDQAGNREHAEINKAVPLEKEYTPNIENTTFEKQKKMVEKKKRLTSEAQPENSVDTLKSSKLKTKSEAAQKHVADHTVVEDSDSTVLKNTTVQERESAWKKDFNPVKSDRKLYSFLDVKFYTRVLSYLSFLAKDKRGKIEQRFSRFLKMEFDLTEKEIDRILRMAFWKNFVVLQEEWAPGETNLLKKAFDREIAIKKAGFEAQGIFLMNTGIESSKAKLADMLDELKQVSHNQKKSKEDQQ